MFSTVWVVFIPGAQGGARFPDAGLRAPAGRAVGSERIVARI
jgi:hypothetical protein